MVYALRQYLKGVKGSGTKDLWVGDVIPTRDEIAERYGAKGKYVVMERGKGIRGMRKVAEYIFQESQRISASESEWMPKVFAAEHESSMSVRKEIQLKELSDEDLGGLWDSMLETPVESDDDFQRFVADNSKLKKEMYRRLKDKETSMAEGESASLASENTGKSFGYGTIVTAGIVGLVAGAVMQEVRWKKRFDAAESKMKDLEDLIDALTKKAEEATQPKSFNASNGTLNNYDILRSFNQRSGY